MHLQLRETIVWVWQHVSIWKSLWDQRILGSRLLDACIRFSWTNSSPVTHFSKTVWTTSQLQVVHIQYPVITRWHTEGIGYVYYTWVSIISMWLWLWLMLHKLQKPSSLISEPGHLISFVSFYLALTNLSRTWLITTDLLAKSSV